MKWINNFEPLIINKLQSNDIKLEKYSTNSWIIHDDNKDYLAVKRTFTNDIKEFDTMPIVHDNYEFEIKEKPNAITNFSLEYGSDRDFIIDMNGIDNFRFAESQIFNDYTIRKVAQKLNLLDPDKQYLRIGASGARENFFHPSGEVFEYSLINGDNVGGLSQNVSGYLPQNECYSKSIPLYNEDKKTLREERTVYSHTAWLEKCELNKSKCILINIKVKNRQQSLLDILRDIAIELNLKCYSMQIYIKTFNNTDTQIKGRVLKHIPERPFRDIPEVVDISYEKLYNLEEAEVMYGMGTKYDRYEPEWTEFTDGGIYERRGHIHATIIKNEKNTTLNKKHETFHLRDVFVSQSTEIQVAFNPIRTIYRIYPIHKENNNYICNASKKNIETVIKNIDLIDSKN